MESRIVCEALAFDDVSIIPGRSSIVPRQACTATALAPGVELEVPILSAAMDTVTEAAMAIAMARAGGMGIIHKNMSTPRQAGHVRMVKSSGGSGMKVGAAVGVGEIDRAAELVGAGVDLLAVDSAHGHSEAVLETVENIRKRFSTPVMAGNVVTAQGVEDLVKAGTAVVKVGVGPGSICTTRVVAGVGVPQWTALSWCCPVARELGAVIVADGGIRHSGDVVKALALGAGAVMIGRLFGGADESPGETYIDEGMTLKVYRGMGSLGAMGAGSADRYGQDADTEPDKLVPEGVEASVPAAGPVADLVAGLTGGLRAGMGYVGARDLRELCERARFIRQTRSGITESHVHDLAVYESTLNYPGKEG